MSKRKKRWLVGLGATALAAGTAFQFQRLMSEEPSYEVVHRTGGIEVRQYGPRVIARTRVPSDDAASNDGFRTLAGYIFGGNDGGRSIAMTTPVTTESEGARIAMTTPVETASDAEGMYMTFTMPSEYSLEDLPTPDDPRVELMEVPGRRVASLRFSGRVSTALVQDKKRALLSAIREAGLTPSGEPYVAQYDPPWVLPFLRRNEVQVLIEG